MRNRRRLCANAERPTLGTVLGPVLGVVLAGGRARRMGRDKAQVEVDGIPMAQRVATALYQVTPDVVCVGRDRGLAGLRCIPDRLPGPRGPLAGLVTALASAGGPVVLVAVDQPLVRPATLRELVALASPGRAAVPVAGGARQVTCAVYPAGWAAEAAAEDDAGGSIQSLLDRLGAREVPEDVWASWGEDGRSWFSVDAPEDVAAAEALLRGDRLRP